MVSTQNVLGMQQSLKAANLTVKVSDFTTAPGVDAEPTCRALGALEVAPGRSPAQYVQAAFQDELFAAGVIDVTKGVAISGEITELNFNSFGTGVWKLAVKFSSPSLPDGFTVREEYSFKSSFSALSACQNVIDAFQPTVSALIASAIKHPDFQKLAGA